MIESVWYAISSRATVDAVPPNVPSRMKVWISSGMFAVVLGMRYDLVETAEDAVVQLDELHEILFDGVTHG